MWEYGILQGFHQPAAQAVAPAGAAISARTGICRQAGQPTLHLASDHDRRPGEERVPPMHCTEVERKGFCVSE